MPDVVREEEDSMSSKWQKTVYCVISRFVRLFAAVKFKFHPRSRMMYHFQY